MSERDSPECEWWIQWGEVDRWGLPHGVRIKPIGRYRAADHYQWTGKSGPYRNVAEAQAAYTAFLPLEAPGILFPSRVRLMGRGSKSIPEADRIPPWHVAEGEHWAERERLRQKALAAAGYLNPGIKGTCFITRAELLQIRAGTGDRLLTNLYQMAVGSSRRHLEAARTLTDKDYALHEVEDARAVIPIRDGTQAEATRFFLLALKQWRHADIGDWVFDDRMPRLRPVPADTKTSANVLACGSRTDTRLFTWQDFAFPHGQSVQLQNAAKFFPDPAPDQISVRLWHRVA